MFVFEKRIWKSRRIVIINEIRLLQCQEMKSKGIWIELILHKNDYDSRIKI